MTYRLRNIAIAVALAVLAAMMTSFYVKQQKQDIQQGQVLTTVWVAKADFPAGTAGDDISGQLASTQVAKSSVTPGAIVQPEDLAGKVTSEPIYAGEQVSLLRFATEGEQGIRAQLTGNLRAFQLPGDANQLLSGTLETGDHVDVVGAWEVKSADSQNVSRIVLRDILVLQAPEVELRFSLVPPAHTAHRHDSSHGIASRAGSLPIRGEFGSTPIAGFAACDTRRSEGRVRTICRR